MGNPVATWPRLDWLHCHSRMRGRRKVLHCPSDGAGGHWMGTGSRFELSRLCPMELISMHVARGLYFSHPTLRISPYSSFLFI